MREPDIPKPTREVLKEYPAKWDTLETYVLQEKSLRLLFRETYPRNEQIEHVLIKVSCLNDFYSTNIFSAFAVAKHILSLSIDKPLAAGDDELVNNIATVTVAGDKRRNFYSFASKYCSHHRPERYPIYDYYVEKMLIHFRQKYNFTSFRKQDLRDYRKFRTVLEKFREFFGFGDASLKDIDKYLWLAGKKYFRKQYGQKNGPAPRSLTS